MKIAYFAWGSLLWDSEGLNLKTNWKKTNIYIPLNFSRISDNGKGRLTLVIDNINGISKKELVWNLRKYNKIAQQNPDVPDDKLVDFYVFKLCKYYPVTFGEGSASNPEELKVKAAKDFQNYVKASRIFALY